MAAAFCSCVWRKGSHWENYLFNLTLKRRKGLKEADVFLNMKHMTVSAGFAQEAAFEWI